MAAVSAQRRTKLRLESDSNLVQGEEQCVGS
jgi:hypothetical protein